MIRHTPEVWINYKKILPPRYVSMIARILFKFQYNNILSKCYKVKRLPKRISKFWKKLLSYQKSLIPIKPRYKMFSDAKLYMIWLDTQPIKSWETQYK